MEGIGQWGISLCLAAAVTAAVSLVGEGKKRRGALRLVCGLAFTLALLAPLGDYSVLDFDFESDMAVEGFYDTDLMVAETARELISAELNARLTEAGFAIDHIEASVNTDRQDGIYLERIAISAPPQPGLEAAVQELTGLEPEIKDG